MKMDKIVVWQIIKRQIPIKWTLGELKKELNKKDNSIDVAEIFESHPKYSDFIRYKVSNLGNIKYSSDSGQNWELIEQKKWLFNKI